MSVGIAYIISQVSQSKVFEWTSILLSRKKYKLVFILMHEKETPFEKSLIENGFSVHRVLFKNKYDIPSCIISIRKILRKEKISIVHTHLFEAGLAGLSAAKLAGIPKRIHTRHDATIHHHYHPQAVKYDKIINNLSTDLIAITENVKNILTELEGVKPGKIRIIHHGFKMEEFADVSEERIAALKQKYFPNGKPQTVIGVVSRFIEWKGIHYIIPAFKELLNKNPDAHLVLANAQGPFAKEIEKLLAGLPQGSYTKIIFEPDVIALYRLYDIFIHTPVDKQCEAFGQVYIEAMAAGVPSVVTLSGIANDFIRDHVHAMVVPWCDSASITKSIAELLADEKLRLEISAKAKAYVHAEFQIEKMIRELENLYDA